MDAVNVCIQNDKQPEMTPSLNFMALSGILPDELIEFQDFVFVLGKLWKLDVSHIQQYWTCNLFAKGMVAQGKSVS